MALPNAQVESPRSPARAPQTLNPVETGCPLAEARRQLEQLLHEAVLQTLLGRHDWAAAFHAEADQAQAVLDLLRGAAAARPATVARNPLLAEPVHV